MSLNWSFSYKKIFATWPKLGYCLRLPDFSDLFYFSDLSDISNLSNLSELVNNWASHTMRTNLLN